MTESNLALKLIEHERPAPIAADFESLAVVEKRQRVDVRRDLTDTQRVVKNQRLAFCREVHALVARNLSAAEAVNAVSVRAEQFDRLITAGKHGKSTLTVRNYRNWLGKLGKDAIGRPRWDNHQALADRYCTNVRARAGSPRFWDFFGAFYLTTHQRSYPEAYRLAQAAARADGVLDLDHPTLTQVRHWFKQHADPTAVALMRLGKDAAQELYCGYILRDWSTVRVGEFWYGDHHVFDCAVRVWDEQAGAWRPTRPWLTAWMDAKSQFFTGWVIRAGEHPDSLAVEEALLDGIRKNGNAPPVLLGIDNGKDYTSAGFLHPITFDDGKNNHSIASALGCTHTTALPYNAKSKLIERRFADVCGSFAKWWPAYLGNSPQNKPPEAMQHWNAPESLPSLQQFVEAFTHWLHNVYHVAATASKVTGGTPPAEAWDAREPVREPLTDPDLFHAFLKPWDTLKQVRKGGMLRHANRWYQSDRLWPHIGAKVLVKLDRANPSHLFAYTPEGKLLAECTAPVQVPAIARTDADRKLIGQQQSKYHKQLSHALTAAKELTGGLKVVPPVAHLLLSAPGAPLPVLQSPADPASAAAGDASPAVELPAAGSAPFSEPEPVDAALVAELDALLHTTTEETDPDPNDPDVAELSALLADHARKEDPHASESLHPW